ncbi:MAG: hypothetical protein ACRCUS_01295 [Anaerovoracaceae bacterium]
MTNYEDIKNMSIERLTEFILEMPHCKKCIYQEQRCTVEMCRKGIALWLQSQSKNGIIKVPTAAEKRDTNTAAEYY